MASAGIQIPYDDSDPDKDTREHWFNKNVHEKPAENREWQRTEDCRDGEAPHMKKQRTLGNNETGEVIDWLRADVCILCDREDDEVLVCHETGCPVALHKQCMICKPDFDESGNFYCPHCWYKRQVLRSRKLKEKAIAAETAFAAGKVVENEMAVDMDVEMEKTSRENEKFVEVNVSFVKKRNLSHCENRRGNVDLGNQRVELEKNQQNKMGGDETLDFDVPRDGERRRKKDLKELEGIKESGAKDQRKRAEEEKGMDGFDVLEDDGERTQEPQNDFGEDEQVEANSSSTVSSPTSTNGSDGCDLYSGGFALAVCPISIATAITEESAPYDVGPSKSSSSRPGNSQIGNRSSQATNVVLYNSPTKRKNLMIGDGKRKRLYWTTKEEEMLRIGVHEFSTSVNKNMPWRKILEFGQHVFHEERTPSDLKDKWKNMNKPA